MHSLKALARRKAYELLSSRTGLSQKFAQVLFARQEGARTESVPRLPLPKPLTLKKVEALLEVRAPAAKAALAWISPTAVTASLGQVHEARLRDGRPVALKVQYPGLAQQVERELSWLLVAARLSPARAAGVNFEAHGAALRCQLAQELDYTQEASNLNDARAFAARVFPARAGTAQGDGGSLHTPLVAIPEPLVSLSTKDVLLMDWLPFESARGAAAWEPREAAHFLEDMFTFTLGALFAEGRLYADAHLGNIGRARGHSAAVDFGVFTHIEVRQVAALKGLVQVCLEERAVPLVPYFERAGFDTSDVPGWQALGQRLPALCEALFLPFRGPGLAREDDFRVGAHARAILGEEAWTFRASGPPWFFGVMRLLGSLFTAARHVGVPFNAAGALQRALAFEGGPSAWHMEPGSGLEGSLQNKALQHIVPPHTALARLLRVQLVREGRDVVCVEMPARAAFRLEDLLNEDVRSRIHATGRTASEIQTQLLARGLLPGEVLRATTENGTLFLSLV
ncbi:MAG: hypothetical protein IOD12_17205 [Silvanigrellales bacterium]|nr:hypothetical protein [Silvanigrellales bacterium]